MKRVLLFALAVIIAVLVTTATASASATPVRPLKGTCVTTFTIDFTVLPPVAHIFGTCRLTHLGATRYEALQRLLPDDVVVSDATYTAANGDKLFVHATGQGTMVGPAMLALTFSEWITGGTGRFAHVVAPPLNGPPSDTGTGLIDLAGSTGTFTSKGWIAY